MASDGKLAEYLRRREAQERDLATKATSLQVLNIHLDFAERYRMRAEEVERQDERNDEGD